MQIKQNISSVSLPNILISSGKFVLVVFLYFCVGLRAEDFQLYLAPWSKFRYVYIGFINKILLIVQTGYAWHSQYKINNNIQSEISFLIWLPQEHELWSWKVLITHQDTFSNRTIETFFDVVYNICGRRWSFHIVVHVQRRGLDVQSNRMNLILCLTNCRK